jgi:hypothetical protein
LIAGDHQKTAFYGQRVSGTIIISLFVTSQAPLYSVWGVLVIPASLSTKAILILLTGYVLIRITTRD